MTKIMNMQDLLDNLETLEYSTKTIDQIRPRIKECERIYKTPLKNIPVDPAKFEEMWGRGRIGAIAKGFKSYKHFLEWRKRVRGALNKAAGPKAPKALLPDWVALSGFAKDEGGVGRLLGPHRYAGIEAVGIVASADGLVPSDLKACWITPAAMPLKGKSRRTFKLGIAALNDLIDLRDDCPEIMNLLPEEKLPQPERAVRPPSPWRHGHLPEAKRLWEDFDAFVSKKRGFDAFGAPIPADQSEFKSRTEKTYINALNLATGLLDRAGEIDRSRSPRLSDICNPEVIARAANLWQTRAIRGEVRTDATTRKNMVARLSHIADVQVGLSKADRKSMTKIKKQVRKTSPKSDAMSPPRLMWIKVFAKSPAQQRAVHLMPETLQREAKAILGRWEELKKKKRHKERMRALSLGIAAVQSVILFRGSALRATNLRSLPFRGDDIQLHMDTDSGGIELSIPASLVKNNVDIEAEFDPDARTIIDWYLEEIRPRLIEDHPYGCKLVDSDFLFPSMHTDRPLEETTFASHYSVGVEAAGLSMTLHQARQITGYLILSVDPSAIALVAAVLNNSVEVAEAHYAWMDGVKAGREARKLLRQARAESRKHRPGTQANDARAA
ncbi:hypothetical protein GLP59_07125 [Sulfitobacter sp. M220]|jgi:hypothetical protein|uniref:hypothetical protein n=1 Tax=Sulfitobacter sp. M220 TaxID=2675333 RepID=UPI001F25C1AB|nr:hypothetical protein [Sulfitobacter sp. M220]MCF7777421.1 hypothetical protein [Sulfitobacter sp. M220]